MSSHLRSHHKAPKFIDSRTKPVRVRHQSKYFAGATFVFEGKPERTIVIQYATPKSYEVNIYGCKNLGSKNMISINGGKLIKTDQELHDLKKLLFDLSIIIPGIDHAKSKQSLLKSIHK